MKTILTLERMDKYGKRLEKQTQSSRSFLKNFIDELYLLHANIGGPIGSGTAYPNGFNVDLAHTDRMRLDGENLSVAAPGGGIGFNGKLGGQSWRSEIPGELIGIVLGSGSIAVTPLDKRLNQIYGNGTRAPDVAPSIIDSYNPQYTSLLTLNANAGQPNVVVANASGFTAGEGVHISDSLHDEWHNILYISGNTLVLDVNLSQNYLVANVAQVYNGDNDGSSANGNNWLGQGFVPSTTHRITSVSIKIYRNGTPGDLTVRIRGSDPYPSYPSRNSINDLTSGTIPQASIPVGASNAAYVSCSLPPADLYAGRKYFIVINCTGSEVIWRRKTNSPLYMKAFTGEPDYWGRRSTWDCVSHSSSDAGVSWNYSGVQIFMFTESGQSLGEFRIGGMEVAPLVVANPNASFSVRRLFANNCGSSLIVSEVGLHTIGGTDVIRNPHLASRDVLSPVITVNDSELLAVTFTPQITV